MPSYYRDPDSPTPNVPRRIGVVALIERDGAVLLQRRSDDDLWDFFGGRVDDNETLVAALHRDVREETGLDIEQFELFGLFSDPRVIAYPDGNVCGPISVAFRVLPKADATAAASDESHEVRWVSVEQLAELEFWPVALPVRDALLSDDGRVVVA